MQMKERFTGHEVVRSTFQYPAILEAHGYFVDFRHVDTLLPYLRTSL
jgi:hypothetical protein